MSRYLGLLIIYCYFCNCVYMETGTSLLTRTPVEATEIPVKRDKLYPYKRNIPVHRDEVKWNLKRRLTRENLPKRKQKETTFVGMLFMRTKLVFVLLTNYQLFLSTWFWLFEFLLPSSFWYFRFIHRHKGAILTNQDSQSTYSHPISLSFILAQIYKLSQHINLLRSSYSKSRVEH